MTDREELDGLREDIRRLDADIVRLASRRLDLARRAGELKLEAGLAIRNYAVEAEVIRLAREHAASEGIPETLAEDLVKMLIKESLRLQERDRRGRSQGDQGRGRRALVVGGAGRMGRWFVEFLDSKGFGVAVCDPRGAPDGHPVVEDVEAHADSFEVIVVATPPTAVASVIKNLAGRTDALVFEIGSLKSPFAAELKALAKQGLSITSVHPMWGPHTDLLASKNVLVCDCGDAAANRAAVALFEDTAAHIFEIGIDDHDAYMARTLGLPHAVNLVYGHGLASQDVPLETLMRMGGPTFLKQASVTREVADENKDLYYEIQRHNPHTGEMLGLLRRSLDELEASLAEREAFRAYMTRAQTYFQGLKR